MAGVNFTHSSAKRIADAVRYVERLTSPDKGPRRNRNFSGGGAEDPLLYAELPPIPESGYVAVIWGTEEQIEGGTGDGHVWETWSGEERWYPRYGFTDKTGVV